MNKKVPLVQLLLLISESKQTNAMPFVKDTSYRDIPFSPESPSTEDFHCFVSIKQLIEQIKHHPDMLRCRTVGTVSCNYGKFVIHELDDSSVQIRLSLAHLFTEPPSSVKPYAAQVFGFVYWKESVGPVIQPYVLQSIPVSVAVRLRETMRWVNQTHAANREKERNEE